MSTLEAIVLGLVQGLTEFLPISSTAHLRLVPALAGWSDPGAAFTAIVQLGTLVAVFLYFRSDVVRLLKGLVADVRSLRIGSTPDSLLAWKIVIGTLPIVIAGLWLKERIENEFRALTVIAWSLIGFSILLAVAEWRASRRQNSTGSLNEIETSLTWGEVLLIGLFQALALIPGASRSGVTITAGLFLGMSRSSAARFSFLLSLPSILGAGLYQLAKEHKTIFASQEALVPILIATVVAGLVGYASIAFLLGFLKRYSTYGFVIYRILLGIVILILVSRGVLPDLVRP
jgi:undecaprenyl-diphosphatase